MGQWTKWTQTARKERVFHQFSHFLEGKVDLPRGLLIFSFLRNFALFPFTLAAIYWQINCQGQVLWLAAIQGAALGHICGSVFNIYITCPVFYSI